MSKCSICESQVAFALIEVRNQSRQVYLCGPLITVVYSLRRPVSTHIMKTVDNKLLQTKTLSETKKKNSLLRAQRGKIHKNQGGAARYPMGAEKNFQMR